MTPGRKNLSRNSDNLAERIWYGRSPLYWLLLPLSGMFAVIVYLRRLLYSRGRLWIASVDAPVIVVGNISVGGTGKTPVAIWLAGALKHRGFRPAIVSRGYGGQVGAAPVEVDRNSDARQVGDEAVLMARQCACPVVVHPDRVAAARKAIALGATVIIADDGLQHYRLGRKLELAVVDAKRGFGNGMLLPAGPLREPVSRLAEVDRILVHRHPGDEHELPQRPNWPRILDFSLRVSAVMRLDDSDARHIDDFAGDTVHAIAGIGHPERFFTMLESHGIEVIRHPLADHADIGAYNFDFGDDLDILMTQKDAVKCTSPDTGQCWYVPVDVEFAAGDADDLLARVTGALDTTEAGGK